MQFSIRRFSMLLAFSAAGLALSGCSRIHTHQGYFVDNLLVDSVQPGIDNKESVEGTLGRPSFVSQFGPQDWFYVSRDMRQLAFSNPKPVKEVLLRVRFDQAGNVIGVDRAGLDQVVNLKPRHGKTPTLGRNRSLLDDIFGNIGAVGSAGMGNAGPGSGGSGPNGS